MVEFTTVASALEGRKMSILLYGESGAGKTTLMKTLPFEVSEMIYIAADPGQLALGPNKANQRDLRGVRMFSPKTFAQFGEIARALEAGVPGVKVVWIDGLDQIAEDMLREFKDRERKKGAKGNIQSAYGDMAEVLIGWLMTINRGPVPVVWTTHLDDDRDRDVRYSFSIPGKAARLPIENTFDEVFCLKIAKKDPTDPACEAKRWLQCTRNRDIQYYAKDRSGVLDDFEFPDMSKIFDKIFGKKGK